MKFNGFDEILRRYIFQPEIFWPEDTVFNQRNREKILKARALAKQFSDEALLIQLREDLEKRYEEKRKTLYVISCGSSGCHFLGEMLSSIGNFDLIKEVYYPPVLLSMCQEGQLSEKERMMLFDLVSYFPSKGLANQMPEVTPINIMHLRADTPTKIVKQMGGHHLVLLMRNPFDIAYSRAFRKDDYRAEVDPNASDIEYLVKQINNVKRFYRLVIQKDNVFDDVVRYEDLLRDPYSAIYDLLISAKERFPEAWEGKAGLAQIKSYVGNSQSINFNPEKRKIITPEASEVLLNELYSLALDLGYDNPGFVN